MELTNYLGVIIVITLIPKIHKIFKNVPYSIRFLLSNLLINLPINNRGLSKQKIQKLSKSFLYADDLDAIYNSLTYELNQSSYLVNAEILNNHQKKIKPYLLLLLSLRE